jgi:phosphoenolpyruvate carboxykinase (ATP)
VSVPTQCSNVDSRILIPKQTWHSAAAYDAASRKLSQLFRDNFQQFSQGCAPEVVSAGPIL